jgi:hypothetical protein
MAPIEYVMPVGHDRNDVAKFKGRIVGGTHPFRQPVNFDGQAAQFVRGIELLFDDDDAVDRLFAFMGGTLRFLPATGTTDPSLVIDIDPGTVDHLADGFFAHTLEAAPTRIFYENVDVELSKAKIAALLGDPNHRSRRMAAVKPGAAKQPSVQVSMNALIADPKVGVTGVRDMFFDGTLAVPLLVSAEDVIGVAGPVTGQAKSRRLVWSMADVGRQFVNPLFYVQKLHQTDLDQVTKLLTVMKVGQPIFDLLPLDTAVPPRVSVDVTVDSTTASQVPFAFGPLGDFHGFPLPGGLGVSHDLAVDKSLARLDRRLITPPPPPVPAGKVVGQFEVQDAATKADHPFYKDPAALAARMASATKTMRTLWGRQLTNVPGSPQASATFNAIAGLLGIPCEIVLAILGHESGGHDRAYRIEPLGDGDRKKLRAAHRDQVIELHYDKSAGFLGTLTSVQTMAPPAQLEPVATHPPPLESDHRPVSQVHVHLSEPLGFSPKSANGMVTDYKQKKIQPEPEHHRRLLIVDQATGVRPLIRAAAAVPTGPKTFSATDVDLTIEDEQFFCNRGPVDPTVNALVCAEPKKPSDTQPAGIGVHYNPADACQDVVGSATLTDAVQHTITRAGTLRALYIDADPPGDDVTIIVKINGAPKDSLTKKLTANNDRAAEIGGSEPVNAGDRISLFVQTGAAPITGLRVRLHLAPAVGTAVYVLDGAGDTHVNAYPATGVALTDRVRGPQDPNNQDHPLTWGELADVVQLTAGTRISPGLTQTLISTAHTVLLQLEQIFPDLYTQLAPGGVTARPPSNEANEFRRYLVDDRQGTDPNKPGLGWLMFFPNALLVGAAYLRFGYLGTKQSIPTLFDLPLVCATYNQGGTSFAVDDKKHPVQSDWGVVVTRGEYIPDAATAYNAVVALFEGDPPNTPPLTPIPSTRFRP